ncbi:MAG: ATP-binding protein [Desulfovibrionales bacterium]
MSSSSPTDPSSIKVGLANVRERKRRKYELIFALGALVLVVVLSWLELRFFGVNSFLFLALFNINLILLLLILFLVLRNGVKLVLERKRRVLGSQLRSRLVLAFISLSLLPTIPMFLVSVKFVQTSVDYWFKSQLESSMEQALEVGQAYYNNALEGLEHQGGHIIGEIRERRFAWGGRAMDEYLVGKQREYGLKALGVLNASRREQNWHSTPEWEEIWPEIKQKVDWNTLSDNVRFWSTLWAGTHGDMVVGLMPVDNGRTGFLVMAGGIEQGIFAKLDQIVQGVEEYKTLNTLKYPLKMVLYLFLGVMTLLIIFGAMWFGFRLAKEISAPVQALAIGTQRIASGDLSVRLEDASVDELGLLVKSFNSMAEDLEQSQKGLTKANIRLAQQNRELEERGEYMEAVLNNITAGVISLDNKGQISTVNRAAEAILGADSRKLTGKNPLEFLSGQYREELTSLLQQFQNNPGSQWQRQLELSLKNRDLKLLVNVVSLKTSERSESGLIAVFEDVTELEKMQRMEAWKEVARRIAHEIKNPLTPIKLSAQRLEQKFGPGVDSAVFSQCTQLIVTQVEHLQKMVQEFSSFAKLPEVVLKENFLAPLLEEEVAMFRNSHNSIRWELVFESSIPKTRFDREAIRRVLVNLLTNAAEALDGQEKGYVRVVARHLQDSGLIQVEIRDNGPGLSAEERSRMFEPYYSKKKGGTGLGLTIVASIISDHFGYVRVQANEPAGTVFIMELPVRHEQSLKRV